MFMIEPTLVKLEAINEIFYNQNSHSKQKNVIVSRFPTFFPHQMMLLCIEVKL